MKHLIHTSLNEKDNGDVIKYEIFFKYRKPDYHEKIPEGTYRIIEYRWSSGDLYFNVTDPDVDIQMLYERNKPDPNTWYSDGPHRVSLDMIIEHLEGR